MRRFPFLIVILLLSCSLVRTGIIPSPVSTQAPPSASTKISEEALSATQLAMAYAVKTEIALTSVAQPIFTPWPTPTSEFAHLPTLTAIPNSTPAGDGAYFDVSSDVLGPRYEIQNAYYFNDPYSRERYEFYAGAIAGSGDEETAQGVMVLRVLRFSEKMGKAEVIKTLEYLTPIQVGPLRMKVDFTGSILLFTPLHFEWTYSVLHGEMINIGNPPLARLQVGEESQLAGRGSFCWKGNCADFGIYSNSVPFVVQSPFTAHLHLALAKPPDWLRLSSMLVSPPGQLEYELNSDGEASWSSEKAGRQLLDQGGLLLQRDQDIKLSLEPGYHVLVISAAWHDYGDVQYGFLIEVRE